MLPPATQARRLTSMPRNEMKELAQLNLFFAKRLLA
jgi:hypothetical protein